ncbi:MAG: LptF/LptG family permease, partial [Spirochaetaceae bacterium]|nr:LptF/LptG family permease [Spirochaetaceae bacterium]
IEDRLAIPMMKKRNQVSKELLGIQDSRNRSRAVAITREGHVVYYADYYNDERLILTGLSVIILDEDNRFFKRIDAESATWDDTGTWLMKGCRVFTTDGSGEILQQKLERYRDNQIDEPPSTFRLDTRELVEMNGSEARVWIKTQKKAGLPYKAYQAEFYQRYTTALTPFLVVLFAGALGGRFKRNVLLMSLLASLGLSAAWYIIRMISTLVSQLGIVSPLLGAVVPYIGFLALGIWLFHHAKT